MIGMRRGPACLDEADGLEAVHDGQEQVHQHEIGRFARCKLHALRAIGGDDDLEIAFELQPRLSNATLSSLSSTQRILGIAFPRRMRYASGRR